MATAEEIRRRVEDADTARSAKRSAAAEQIGELAARRATIAEQLDDIERQLGDVLAAARDVMDIDELARFTDVPAADLTRWLAARKPTRAKRKRPTTGAPSADSTTSREPSAARPPAAARASNAPGPSAPRVDAADARVPAQVT